MKTVYKKTAAVILSAIMLVNINAPVMAQSTGNGGGAGKAIVIQNLQNHIVSLPEPEWNVCPCEKTQFIKILFYDNLREIGFYDFIPPNDGYLYSGEVIHYSDLARHSYCDFSTASTMEKYPQGGQWYSSSAFFRRNQIATILKTNIHASKTSYPLSDCDCGLCRPGTYIIDKKLPLSSMQKIYVFLNIDGKVGWGELEFENDKMLFKPVGRMIDLTSKKIDKFKANIKLRRYAESLLNRKMLSNQEITELIEINTPEAKRLISKHFVIEIKAKATIAEKVSVIIKSNFSHEAARMYFEEFGVKELPEMIAYAQEKIELKINNKVPAKFFIEAFAKSMLKKTADPAKYLDKAVEKYPESQRAAKKAEFRKAIEKGRIPKEVAETAFPESESVLKEIALLDKAVKKYSESQRAAKKAAFMAEIDKGNIPEEVVEAAFPQSAQAAKKLNFWEKIKLRFRGGNAAKTGGILGIAMLGIIVGIELIVGKAAANISGLETRLTLGELVGSEYGPGMAGTFCAKAPQIMANVIKDYAGDKENLEFWLIEHFDDQIDFLTSADIMNEPVLKDALEEWNRQKAGGKTAELQKGLQKELEGFSQGRTNPMFEDLAGWI